MGDGITRWRIDSLHVGGLGSPPSDPQWVFTVLSKAFDMVINQSRLFLFIVQKEAMTFYLITITFCRPAYAWTQQVLRWHLLQIRALGFSCLLKDNEVRPFSDIFQLCVARFKGKIWSKELGSDYKECHDVLVSNNNSWCIEWLIDFRSLSRQDLQILVGYGCPSADKKVVFSAKLLRKHVHLDEGDVSFWFFVVKMFFMPYQKFCYWFF